MGTDQEAIERVRNAIEGDGMLVGTDVAVLLAEHQRLTTTNTALERLVATFVSELPPEEREIHLWALRRRADGLTCTAEDYLAERGAEGTGSE